MTIDKISNINNINKLTKTQEITPKANQKILPKDSIEISSQGKEAAQISKHLETIQAAPNIRTELVNNLKNKINSGSYDFNDLNLLKKTANKITKNLLR